jgi:hypothetical protein
LANLLFRESNDLVFNVHCDGGGATIIYKQACALAVKILRRNGSRHAISRLPISLWLKIKYPGAPPMKREVEGHWGGRQKE